MTGPAPDQFDSPWFRAPTRRERLIAAALFIGFGVFFALLFIVQRGWWFRWIILGFAIVSLWYGIRHALLSNVRTQERR